jgi:hypothetical protein
MTTSDVIVESIAAIYLTWLVSLHWSDRSRRSTTRTPRPFGRMHVSRRQPVAKAVGWRKLVPPRWVQVIGVGLLSWVASPESALPFLVFLGLLIKAGIDLGERRDARYVWLLVLAFTFAAVGIIHDATVDNYASALCADGSYSYSANRSGTCSWHHGVLAWHPKIPPWCRKCSTSSP